METLFELRKLACETFEDIESEEIRIEDIKEQHDLTDKQVEKLALYQQECGLAYHKNTYLSLHDDEVECYVNETTLNMLTENESAEEIIGSIHNDIGFLIDSDSAWKILSRMRQIAFDYLKNQYPLATNVGLI